MKLARLRIENFRQFGTEAKPFELDFTDALGRVRDFTLLVGPNGCGKTTILDAIAAAIGPSLEMPTLRSSFKRSPRTVVTRGALHAKVTCWLRFDPVEVDTTREVLHLAELNDSVPDVPEVKVTWTYPDPQHKSDHGFTECDPPTSWTLLKTRVQIARLLVTGRVGWDWFHRAGGVFTFDQERTGLGKTISRQVWNIIHGTAETARENFLHYTMDPRTILIAMAVQALVRRADDGSRLPDQFLLIQERYAQCCSPRDGSWVPCRTSLVSSTSTSATASMSTATRG